MRYRFKRKKRYIKRNEIKDLDIKEKIKKRNIKLKNKVNFIAFHNDNRLENDIFCKSLFPFFYKFCEKYISIFKSQLPIIAKSYFAALRRAKTVIFEI